MNLKPADRVKVGDHIMVSTESWDRRATECEVIAIETENRGRAGSYLVLTLRSLATAQVDRRRWRPGAAVRMA